MIFTAVRPPLRISPVPFFAPDSSAWCGEPIVFYRFVFSPVRRDGHRLFIRNFFLQTILRTLIVNI